MYYQLEMMTKGTTKNTHSQSEWSFLIQNCLDRCLVCSISHLAIKNPSTCGASNYSVLNSDSFDLKHKYLARHDNALQPNTGIQKRDHRNIFPNKLGFRFRASGRICSCNILKFLWPHECWSDH